MNKKKKIRIISIFLMFFILLLFFIFFLYKNKSIVNENNFNNVVSDKENNIDIEQECAKIIDGNESNYINDLNKDLILKYKQWRDLLIEDSKNTYLDYKNIKNFKCELINDADNNQFCLDYKEKNLDWWNSKFENIFLKSIITWNNLCSSLEENKEDCNQNFEHFKNIDKDITNEDLLLMDEFEMSKSVIEMWTGVFLENLNKDFIDKCIKLWNN